MMVDFLGMMKKAEELQAKMAEMQNNLGNLIVEGQSGGGLVTVQLSGKGEMRGLKIDPSLFKEDDVEVLEDLIVTAHNEAKRKAEAEAQQKMSEVTAGLPLPPGMKLPF
jgi:DNA-binding YbaB/EbfC family protein